MKHRPRIIKLCAFLVAGAIINVAVAWALAAYGPFWSYDSNSEYWFEADYESWKPEFIDWWVVRCPFEPVPQLIKPLPKPPAAKEPDESRGTRYTPMVRNEDVMAEIKWAGITLIYIHNDPRSEGAKIVRAVRLDSGFPKQAMTASHWRLEPGDDRETHERICQGIRINPSRASKKWHEYTFLSGMRLLPLGLLWPGFAINTIFYAAILWLLFAAPGFVRRRIRARRGQCPACAYPVGASDVCTECGAAVRTRGT